MEESKEIIVLGAIKHGIGKFEKIQKTTHIDPKELNLILERLEKSDLITVEKKKGWLGEKIEIITTKEGSKIVDDQIKVLQTRWNQMSVMYKAGNKEKLKDSLDENKSFLPMMMFFGVMDMMMFSMMFSSMGMTMSDYVPAESMPEGGDPGMSNSMDDDGSSGFDFDMGF